MTGGEASGGDRKAGGSRGLGGHRVLPPPAREKLDRLVKISRRLCKARELAFYGSEDLTPSQFFKERDAAAAHLPGLLRSGTVSDSHQQGCH